VDDWVQDVAALAYVKEISAWLVVNKWAEPISWTDKPSEAAWLSQWLLSTGQKTPGPFTRAQESRGTRSVSAPLSSRRLRVILRRSQLPY
jgi:hypothetical protein